MLAATTVSLKDGRTAIIRPAVAEDAEGATDLVNAVGSEKKFTLRERATWTLEEERRTLIAGPVDQRAFFIGELEGHVSGMLSIERGIWPKNRHVASFGMACRAECRSLGLGTALLNTAIDWARTNGVRKLTLEVFSSNEPAIRLYRKMAFTEEARLQGQYVVDGKLVDSIVMVRWLV